MTTINNGKYAAFSADVNALIDQAAHIYVNIASDSAGSTIMKASNGSDIDHKLIVSMHYTYPSTDVASGQAVLGNFAIGFSDGSTFTVSDDNESHWYLLDGNVPAVYKQLI